MTPLHIPDTKGEKVQSRPNGAWETTRKKGMYRRLTLRRADGRVYLNRWGIGHDRIGGVLLHRMDAPDPGIDLHDHPWWFASLIIKGGYTEARATIRQPDEQTWTTRRRWLRGSLASASQATSRPQVLTGRSRRGRRPGGCGDGR
jgi:cellulose synthase/poly-beta-1,6-N-acetylglucosamine synthase-like glycosyltransferase